MATDRKSDRTFRNGGCHVLDLTTTWLMVLMLIYVFSYVWPDGDDYG